MSTTSSSASSATSPLIRDFPMDEIVNGSVNDDSPSNQSATVHGATVAPDDVFGSCLLFDKATDRVTIDLTNPVQISDQITISFWACAAKHLSNDASVLLANNKELEIVLPHGDTGTAYWNCGRKTATDGGWSSTAAPAWNGTVNPIWTGQTADSISYSENVNNSGKWANGKLANDKWAHWAFTKNVNTGEMKIYFNGTLLHEESGKGTAIAPIGQLIIGSKSWRGRLCNLKIYNSALTNSEVKKSMLSSKSTQEAFRTSYPLDFSIADQDQPNVFYISEDNIMHTVDIAVENVFDQAIVFEQLNSATTASATDHHLELKFKPSMFEAIVDHTNKAAAEQYIKALTLPTDWASSSADLHPDGKVSLYLLYTGTTAYELATQQALNFQLQYGSANVSLGARTTSVQLKYKNLKYKDDDAIIEGTRIQSVEIINQRGKKNIPLMASVVGSNTILNNGTASNSIKIRLVNTLHPDPNNTEKNKLLFRTDSLDTERNTKFTLWFENLSNDDDELASSTQLQAISVSATNCTITKQVQGSMPVWEITPTVDALGPGKYIDLELTNIVTDKASGLANIHLDYEDILGYWDGQLSVQVEKTPIVHNSAGNVGIGTSTPSEKLEVDGITKTKGLRFDGTVDSHINVDGALYRRSGQVYLTVDDHLYIRGKADDGSDNIKFHFDTNNARLGIGTTNPTEKLEIDGTTKTKGLLFDQNVSNHIEADGALYRYSNQVNLTVDDNFYIRDKDDSSKLFHFDTDNARLGINKTNPQHTLDVNGNVGIAGSDLYLDNSERRGSNNTGSRRALVHDEGDKLHINFGGDYTGGTVISGEVTVQDTTRIKGLRFDYSVDNHIEADGALYRHGGNAHLTIDDHFYIRDKDNGTKFHFNTDNARLGINKTNPSQALDVNGDALINGNVSIKGHDLYLDNESRRNGQTGGNRRALVHFMGDQLHINHGGDYTGGTVITGNVGIGTTDPSCTLEVNGDIKIHGRIYWPGIDGVAWTNNGNDLRIDGDEVRRHSDHRLKKNVDTISGALKKVTALRGVSYQWNEAGLYQKTKDVKERFISKEGTPEENEKVWSAKTKRILDENKGFFKSFIAQELEMVFPEWVKESKEGYKQIDTSEIAPVLVEALKELKTETDAIIDKLKDRIEQLEAKLP